MPLKSGKRELIIERQAPVSPIENQEAIISCSSAYVLLIGMNYRLFGLALAAGLATFLVVGVAITELLQSRIEFSLLVGLPAALVAGALAAGLVAWGVNEGAPAQRRRLATAFGTFGVGCLVVLVAGIFLPIGTTISIVLGAGVGVVAAIASYLRTTGKTPGQSDGSSSN